MSLGSAIGGALAAESPRMQRALRKMSQDPTEPRVFSQAKILVPVGLVCSVLASLVWVNLIANYVSGQSDDIFSIIVPGLGTLAMYMLLAHGLWRRFGVDREKVWTRFGVLFYREIRFREVIGFKVGVERHKLHSADTMVNIDYNRFDYALVYLRLLEELQYRRFNLPRTDIDDPNWELEAQAWRRIFAQTIYSDHREFYDTHPEALEHLNSLTLTPSEYIN